MARGIGFELDEKGELIFVIREYDPEMLVSYETYKKIETYLKEHPEATLAEARFSEVKKEQSK